MNGNNQNVFNLVLVKYIRFLKSRSTNLGKSKSCWKCKIGHISCNWSHMSYIVKTKLEKPVNKKKNVNYLKHLKLLVLETSGRLQHYFGFKDLTLTVRSNCAYKFFYILHIISLSINILQRCVCIYLSFYFSNLHR